MVQAALSFPAILGSPLVLSGITVTCTSDTAPKACIYEAIDIETPVTDQPYLFAECTWNFGDDDSATWSHGSHVGDGTILDKKNRAKGMLVSHVYESATGSPFTPSVDCTDGTYTSHRDFAPITVADPDTTFSATTVCIAASGSDFTDCPGGATQVTNSDASAEIATQLAAGKRRILLKGGDTFTSTSKMLVGIAGPVYIGAFGTGKPTLRTSAGTNGININNAAAADWRFVDLIVDGQDTADYRGIRGDKSAIDMTFLRVEVKNMHVGLDFSADYMNAANTSAPCTGEFPYDGTCTNPIWNHFTFVDSYIHDCGISNGGGNCIYSAGARFVLMGSWVSEARGGEHVVRTPWCSHCIISNNTLENPDAGKVVLTMRAPDFLGSSTIPAGSYSEYSWVADNLIQETNGALAVALADNGTTTSTDESRQRYAVWERNYFKAGSAADFDNSYNNNDAIYVVVRNNIFDDGAKTSANATVSCSDGADASPSPGYCYFYNNTFYTPTAISGYKVSQFSVAQNIYFINNLAWADNVTGTPYVVRVLSGAGVTQNNNSSVAEMQGTNPNFLNGSGLFNTPLDFKIPASGYPYQGGAAVSVWSDFFGVASPETRDMGAVVH